LPTYQYACTECGHEFDTVQSFADASLTECPQCTGKLRKVFNAVGIVFKGSGFYRTDSRSSDAPATTGAGSGDGSGDKAAATKDAGSSTSGKDSGSSTSAGSSGSTAGSSSAGGAGSSGSSSSASAGSSSTKGSAA
jgi:putative FmdB family regulatory protein